METVVIIGGGGFSREVLDVLEACNEASPRYEIAGFVMDPEMGEPGTVINGATVVGGFDWLEANARSVKAICGVGAPERRRQLVRRAASLGVEFFTAIHPAALVTRWVEIGTGTVVTAGCIITNQIRIGNHVQINLNCTVGHDAVLEDFVTIAPGVHVSGRVTLREGAYVGTGTSIIEKTTIGEWSVVGAGGCVVRDIPANVTAVGAPARVIKERAAGWQDQL